MIILIFFFFLQWDSTLATSTDGFREEIIKDFHKKNRKKLMTHHLCHVRRCKRLLSSLYS